MDLFQHAIDLQVINVYQPNITGWVTPRALYEGGYAPDVLAYSNFVDHGTVGANTLRYWGEGNTVAPGNYTLATYLTPRDYTEYKDGKMRDTNNIVFKMIPDNKRCNHLGVCIRPFYNGNTIGNEYESLQNGTHDITEMQYIKGALLYAYNSKLFNIKDYQRQAHGTIALPYGRRSDPWAGKFDIAYSWELVRLIRKDVRIQAFWWGI